MNLEEIVNGLGDVLLYDKDGLPLGQKLKAYAYIFENAVKQDIEVILAHIKEQKWDEYSYTVAEENNKLVPDHLKKHSFKEMTFLVDRTKNYKLIYKICLGSSTG